MGLGNARCCKARQNVVIGAKSRLFLRASLVRYPCGAMSLYDDTLVQCYYLMPLCDVLVQSPYMVALLAIPLYGAFVLWREEKLRPKITTFVVPLRNGILRCDGLFW